MPTAIRLKTISAAFETNKKISLQATGPTICSGDFARHGTVKFDAQGSKYLKTTIMGQRFVIGGAAHPRSAKKKPPAVPMVFLSSLLHASPLHHNPLLGMLRAAGEEARVNIHISRRRINPCDFH
jgi:hypothetical protein